MHDEIEVSFDKSLSETKKLVKELYDLEDEHESKPRENTVKMFIKLEEVKMLLNRKR